MMKLQQRIRHSFDKAAAHYEKSALIQEEIGQRLFQRLDYFKQQPLSILDLGAGTGIFSRLLKKKYPKAWLFSLDLSFAMLQVVAKKQHFFRTWPMIQANMMLLPFKDSSMDLIFSNQVIHWACDIPMFLKEIHRVLKPDGVLLFSTLGPDTFKEINQAFGAESQFAHINSFRDMHDIGDMLLAEKFLDPVMDMENITLHYASLQKLLQDLREQGVKNIHPDRNKGLTGKTIWKNFEHSYPKLINENRYPLTYEVIYGCAFKGQQHQTKAGLEIHIPISQLKLRS